MILLITNFEEKIPLNDLTFFFLLQDVNVLMDIVESVSPTIPDNWDDYQEESEVKIVGKIIQFNCF